MVTTREILAALGGIIDPDFKKDIVSLGFVKNILIEKSHVSFDIQLTTPACPVKNEFKNKAEQTVLALEGVKTVAVTMTARERTKSSLEENTGLKGVKSIIAVSSCKGGVGKSTVAAILACEVARRGFQVGLLDADIFGPSIPTLFNLHNVKIQETSDRKMIPVDVDALKVMSFGFFLGDRPAVMRGPMVSNYVKNLLHGVEWEELDYLFLDMPPGTGDVQLTITQAVQLDGAVIVTTPQLLSLVDVGKGIMMFDKVNVPMLGVVENMAYFVCDQCSKRHHIFGGDAADVLRERFGVDILARLPVSDSYNATFEAYAPNEINSILADEVIKAFGRSTIKADSRPEIRFDQSKVVLAWKDGTAASVTNIELRASCKCANCIHETTGELLLRKEDIPMDIRAEEISVVGNYAVSITWSDGHSSGLYSFSSIKKLAGT